MQQINVTDIGFLIGNVTHEEGGTGCTAIVAPNGAAAGVSVQGSAPATRETDCLNPINMIDAIHAVVLSGGSAYGLEACSGVMQYLEQQGVGFDVGVGRVPIVCGASLFDLACGRFDVRPDKEMGYRAGQYAYEGGSYQDGNYGAGTGASVGKYLGMKTAMKTGIGSYAVQIGELKIGAIVAVNALGDIFDLHTGKQIAGILEQGKLCSTEQVMLTKIFEQHESWRENTTIGCVLTNARLSKVAANKVAQMAHDGYARTINPIHTSLDGDTIFTMALGEVEGLSTDTLGTLAARVMGEAINNAVRHSKSAYGLTAFCDMKG